MTAPLDLDDPVPDDPTSGPDSTVPGDDLTGSASYIERRIALLRERVRLLVERRSAGDPTAQDPFRGLYLAPETAEWLADQGAPLPYRDAVHDQAVQDLAEDGARLLGLAAAFGLDALDVEILLIAAAPDVDRSFESLYGYLNDDVSRRRATVGLALDLCGSPAGSAAARARFAPGAPLVAGRLLVVEEPERPFLGRAVRVPDRIIDHILGGDTLDGDLVGTAVLENVRPTEPDDPTGLARWLSGTGTSLVYLREERPGAGVAAASHALAVAGLQQLRADPSVLDASLVPTLVREARLRGAGIVVGPLDGTSATGTLVRAFTTATSGGRVPVLLAGAQPFDPAWSETQPLVLEVEARPTAGAWEAELARAGVDIDALGFDLAAATATYRFDTPQIRSAVRAAVDYAAVKNVPLAPVHLHRGARLQNATGLQKHARRIRPAVGWDDLVLPDEQRGQLLELVSRARHRDRVLGDWRLRAGGGRGRGVVAMFAGESGTGKTMSSEVVAGDLGLDLYVVELSAVVDKYVGETEKNLEKIFTEAGRLDAVLLFDEADAVFGKRSEVKDSHDRYANLESAYLLQRLESFDGIAILTTNLRANIDDAFTRRLDLVVDFPFPDARQRRALWEHALAPPVPCADDIDLDRCAREFELSGGAIRGAATTAAYLAAGADRPVSMPDVLAGARREYRKMGRLLPGDMEY
ncbi:ATP-binding protein [Actinomadura rupiterrae]|uniref:ATP-binding protein n=1 Tax=Actinomadura rupiterrae TaxID=559627 RepID=UPI0020A4A5E3|nr:ATP-binding protein [Actinomadura rupiterrae]MCP2342455.1 hypothetical protein [Actinomadura rupiterrae]